MATANVNTVPTKADRTKVVFPRKHLVPGERIALGREAVHACLFRTSVDHPFSGRGRYRAALRDGSTGQGSDRIYPSSDDRSSLPVPSGHPSSLGDPEGGLGLLVLALLLVSDYTSFGKIPVYLAFLPLLVAFIAFVIHFIEWRNTVFAMSDRRIMTQYGVFDIRFADTHIDRVQDVRSSRAFPRE